MATLEVMLNEEIAATPTLRQVERHPRLRAVQSCWSSEPSHSRPSRAARTTARSCER